MAQTNADRLGVSVAEDSLGGVPVLRVRPPGDVRGRNTLIYVHGGGYVTFSARSSLTVAALVAARSGDEVISIDYTLAPHASWRQATDRVLGVWQATLAAGSSLQKPVSSATPRAVR